MEWNIPSRSLQNKFWKWTSYCNNHPPTELREGNLFIHVCPSVCQGGGPCVTITIPIAGHQTWNPPPKPWPPLLVISGGHHWKPLQTCSLEVRPPVLTSGGDTKACTTGKRAVHILLECFLVTLYISSFSSKNINYWYK